MSKRAAIVWFTGLSGSGKTTIANLLLKQLESEGHKVDVLDGDVVRNTLHKHLGFTPEDIRENLRLITELCEERRADYDFILVPVIAPFRDARDYARRTLGSRFIEVFVNTPLEECIKRDVKGLYKKALAGEIPNFIGIAPENPYEPPLSPDVEVITRTESVEAGVQKIIQALKRLPSSL